PSSGVPCQRRKLAHGACGHHPKVVPTAPPNRRNLGGESAREGRPDHVVLVKPVGVPHRKPAAHRPDILRTRSPNAEETLRTAAFGFFPLLTVVMPNCSLGADSPNIIPSASPQASELESLHRGFDGAPTVSAASRRRCAGIHAGIVPRTAVGKL